MKLASTYDAIMARGGKPGLRERPVTQAYREAVAKGATPEQAMEAVVAALERRREATGGR